MDKNFVLEKINEYDNIRLQDFELEEKILEKGFFTIDDVISAGQISFSPGESPEFISEYYDIRGRIVQINIDGSESEEQTTYVFSYDNDLPLYLDDPLE